MSRSPRLTGLLLLLLVGCSGTGDYRPIVSVADPGARTVALAVAVVRPSPEQPAMAHLMEHLFLRGTYRGRPHRPRLRIAEMGGRVRADTGPDLIVWSAQVPAERWGEALDLLMRGFAARWSEAEVGQALRVIEAERRLSAPDVAAWRALAGEVFAPSGIGALFEGFPRSTSPLDARRVAAEAPRYLQRMRALAAVIGPVPREAFAERLEAAWSRLEQPAGPRERPARFFALRFSVGSRGGRVEGRPPSLLLGLPVPGAGDRRARDSALHVLAAGLSRGRTRASYRRFVWGGLLGIERVGADAPAALGRALADEQGQQLAAYRAAAVARWLVARESPTDHARALLEEAARGSRVDPASLEAVGPRALRRVVEAARDGAGRYWLGRGLDPPAPDARDYPLPESGWGDSRPVLLGRRSVAPRTRVVDLPGGRRLVMLTQGATRISRVGLLVAPPADRPLSAAAVSRVRSALRGLGPRWRLARAGSRLLLHGIGGPRELGRLAAWLRSPRSGSGLQPRVAIPPARLKVERAIGALAGAGSERDAVAALRGATLVICGRFDAARAVAAVSVKGPAPPPRAELSPAPADARPGLPRLFLGYRWEPSSAGAVTALETELRLWALEHLIQGAPALYRVRLTRGRGWTVWELAGLPDGLSAARAAFTARLAALGQEPLTPLRLALLRRSQAGQRLLAADDTRSGLAWWFGARGALEGVDGAAVMRLAAALEPVVAVAPAKR